MAKPFQLTTPILFLIFNRPECTARVLNEIRQARPTKLFIVADGPRVDSPDDVSKCAEVRRIIDDGLDWHCEVLQNYSDINMGCAQRVSSGISWFFENVEEGIILEDDCLPDRTFFPFCQELLGKFRFDARIGQICGTPFICQELQRSSSYIFSRYGPIWGWASWRRAWKYYDLRLSNWPQAKELSCLDSISLTSHEKKKRHAIYENIYNGNLYTWDYQWGYAKMSQSLLSIIPSVNMIVNIGFGVDATHTSSTKKSELVMGNTAFPLRHPDFILNDISFDHKFSNAFTGSRLDDLFVMIYHLFKER